MKYLKILFFVFTVSIIVISSGCDHVSTTDDIQRKKTEQSLSEANRQIGMPAIINFQEKKQYKTILEKRDQANMITYTYLANTMNGTVGQFLGKSIGFGIPAATQYTNPEYIAYSSHQTGVLSLPQPDPNGLYMPTSTSATWVMLLDTAGVPHPTYIEPLIIVSTFKLPN